MSCTHHNFHGNLLGHVNFQLEVCDAGADCLEDVRQVLLGNDALQYKDGNAHVDVLDKAGNPIPNRARRRAEDIIFSRIISGGEGISLTYLGGWCSNGEYWGPDGKGGDVFDSEDPNYFERWG